MGNFKEEWAKMTPPEKFNFVVMMILCVAVIVLAFLGIFKVLPTGVTNRFVMPLLGVITLFYGVKSIRKNKPTAIFIIACGLFVLGLSFVINFM